MNTFGIIVLCVIIAIFACYIINRICHYISMFIWHWSWDVFIGQYWFNKGMTIRDALEDIKDAYYSFPLWEDLSRDWIKFVPLLNLCECVILCINLVVFVFALFTIIFRVVHHIIPYIVENIIYPYFVKYLVNIAKFIYNKFTIILNLLHIDKFYIWIKFLYKRIINAILDIRIS